MIVVGTARLMGDGSGDASVTVQVHGGKKRQVRVVRGMTADSWTLYSTPKGLRLIHWAARDLPFGFYRVEGAESAVQEILEKGREVMDDPKLQRGVLKAIRKRKEVQRRERVHVKATYVAAAIREMLSAGSTHEEVMDAVNAALVAAVHNS